MKVDVGKVVERLRELSDYEYQRRVWLSNRGFEQSSFVEAVSGLFDDSGLTDSLGRRTPIFGEHVDKVLLELSRTIDQIDSRQGPAQLIEDKRMRRVRELASTALSLLGA
jgi:hypothetical protein